MKELESLTYACSSPTDLLLLNDRLDSLKKEFQSKLPQEEGLIIRPYLISTAMKTKRKYAHLKARQRLKNFSALQEEKKRRKKPTGYSKFHNRVGIKADHLRKV